MPLHIASPSAAVPLALPAGNQKTMPPEQIRARLPADADADAAELFAGKPPSLGPVNHAVRNPLFHPLGQNYASQIILTEGSGEASATTHPQPPNAAFGIGLGVSENGSDLDPATGARKRQYFLAVRYIQGATKADRLTVSLENTSADDRFVNRSLPTLLTTFAAPVRALSGTKSIGPLDLKLGMNFVASNFRNPRVNAIQGGVSFSGSLGRGDVTGVTVAKTLQFRDNRPKVDTTEEINALIAGASTKDVNRLAKRAMPWLEQDAPPVVNSAVIAGYTAKTGPDVPFPFGGQSTLTATFPLDEKDIPAGYKSIIDKVEALQRYPDPRAGQRALERYAAQLKQQPGLFEGLEIWEKSELIKHSAPDQNQAVQESAAIISQVAAQSVDRLGEALGKVANFFLRLLEPESLREAH